MKKLRLSLSRLNLSRFQLPSFNLPGGARLWVTLASIGFLLAALAGNARQLLQRAAQPPVGEHAIEPIGGFAHVFQHQHRST